LEIGLGKSRRTTSNKELFDYIPATTKIKKPNFRLPRPHLDYIYKKYHLKTA